MTSGPTYGGGFIDLSPRLERNALVSIERQLERTFSGIDLDIDETPIRNLEEHASRLAGHFDRSETEARRLANELVDSSQAANRVEASARDVAQALGTSDDEARRLAAELRRADAAAESIDVRSGRIATRFGTMRTAAGGLAGALAAVGGAQFLASALSGANSAIQAFAELEDSVNAVNVTFGDASQTIFNFGEDVAQSAGLSRQAFQQLVVPIGSLLRNFGFDAQAAAGASVELVQRAADLASVFGGDVTEALTAVQAALRGESDPIERFGASISAARVEAYALSEGLAATKAEITDAVRVQARLGLILSDTARVQGDFANTAGDLANAQRSAGAAAANFAADVGEALAPALESLVAVLPEVLEGVRQLVPGFAAGADSAADFFDAVGQDGGAGFRTFSAAVGGLVGTSQDVSGAVLDIAQGVIALVDPFASAEEQAEQFQTRLDRITQRGIGIRMARSLDAGADSLEAFGDALEQQGRASENVAVLEQAFRAFAIQANLTDQELLTVTGDLIESGTAAGFSAQELDVLRAQYALLRNTIQPVGNEVAQAARAMDEFANSSLGAEGPFGNFVDVVESEAARLSTFTGQMQEATNDIAEAIDPFKKADERIAVSARQFFKNIVAQVNQQAAFQANIAKLIGAGFDDVAREIAEAGPGANQAAEEFLGNFDLAGKAEALLEGQGTAIADQVGSELAETLSSTPLTAQQERAFIELMDAGIFSNAQVQRAIQSGTLGTAEDIAAGVQRAFGGVDFNIEIDLTEEGEEARATFITGLTTRTAGETGRLRQSILQTVNGAIQRQSPPKLFYDAGVDSGEALWAGFNSVPLDFPTIDFRKQIGKLPVDVIEPELDGLGAAGGPAIENVNFYDTREKPAEESLQEAGVAVAVMLNLRK